MRAFLRTVIRLAYVFTLAQFFICEAQIGGKDNTFKLTGNSKLGGRKFHNPGYDCRKELGGELFEKPTRGKQCSADLIEQCKTVVEFLDPAKTATSKDFTRADEPVDVTIKEIEFLPYALHPHKMDNFVQTKRKLSEAYRMSTDMVGPDSVQFYLGTKDDGRTLLIFFPGTSNLKDVKIDINVKHVEVSLPGLVQDRFRYKYPTKWKRDDPAHNAKLEKISEFDFDRFYARKRVHNGIHRRLYDAEIQRALQEDLLYLYSGIPVMAQISWGKWIRENEIPDTLRDKLKQFGFARNMSAPAESAIAGDVVWYTNPRAMHMKSTQFLDFIERGKTTPEEIDLLVKGIGAITKKLIKRQRNGIDIQKVEKLIISGHSLGASYATYFFLRLYGDGFSRKMPGYDVFPDDPSNVVVIPFAGPNIVFWEHTRHIKSEIASRIFNIWNYNDPVPMILNGMKYINRENLGLTFNTMMAHLSDDSLENLGTNQPVGNLIVFMRGKQRIKLTKSEMEEKKKSWLKRTFLSGGKNWKEDSEEQVWFKVFPYTRTRIVHPEGTPADQKALYYAKYGAHCLWKMTNGGVLGAIPGAFKYHPMERYQEMIRDSCLNDWLQEHSKYWQEMFPPKLLKPKESAGTKLKKLFGFGKSARVSDYNAYDRQQMMYFTYEPVGHDESYVTISCVIVAIALMCLILMAYAFAVGSIWGYVSKRNNDFDIDF